MTKGPIRHFVVLGLAWSNITGRKIRAILTAAAIGLSVSLVVAVTSGYASGEAAALGYLNRYLGGADAQITRPQPIADGLVPQHLIVELFKDPDIHRLTGRLEARSDLFDKDGKLVKDTTFHLYGIGMPDDSRIDSLVVEAGHWFERSDTHEAVIDQVAADALKAGVGDTIYLPADGGKLALKVVGIIHKPEILAAAAKAVYVPLETLQHVEHVDGPDSQISQIAIDLNPGVDAGAFAKRWNDRLAQLNQGQQQPLVLQMVSRNRSEMNSNMRSLRLLSYLGGAVSLLAATFIIFSSLAMGLNERQRTLGMLRAIGATRFQIARLVLWEGILIVIAGLVVGVPLGLLWTECLRWLFSDLFVAGIAISWPGMAMAIGGALAAALAASALPAWGASRLSPLEAMSPLAVVKTQGPPWRWTLVGMGLICIDPAIVFVPWARWVTGGAPSAGAEQVATLWRFYIHLAIGVEGMFVGFFLLAPMLVWALEGALAGVLGWMLGLPGSLLRQQLSSGLWRAAGAGAALMVGLAVLVVMTSQGISMLDGWKLPDKFPDIFLVSLKLGGLSPDQWAKVGRTPGIAHFSDGEAELLPVAITVSGLGNNPLALVGAALAPKMNGTMFFGVPPKEAFEMMELDFRDNDGKSVGRDEQAAYAKRAAEALGLGRHVIVTEDYRRLHHTKYGDQIDLYSDSQKYQYTVCGIVWSPGLDVVVSMFDMGRQLDQRTAGMVFGSLDDARRDFGVDNINLFIANLEPGVDKKAILDDLRSRLGDLNIRAGDVRQIKASIDSGFRHILALLTTVAFSAMAVASMGVTNTIMASIRSRRWQLGVLRSIGLCGGELLRMVLAEAVVLGLVGLGLGLGCGLILSMDARQLGGDVLGYLPPMVMPWGYVSIGAGAVMVVSVAAALWPAWSVSRTEPLVLLQAGRGAA